MDEETNETVVDAAEEVETPEADLTPETDWEAEAKKARGIAQRLRTKLTKAEEKKKEPVVPTTVPDKKTQKTGELDETTLDYLDLKGITDSEDIDVIQKVVERTGQTVRQVLKDEYVIAKLASQKESREVRAATPSGTKRSGAGQTNDLAIAIANFEKTGVLPSDFTLASAVTNAVANKGDVSKPVWQRG